MTFASAVRHGISRSPWNTMPTLPRKNSKSRNGLWPLTATSPAVGSINPAIRLNMVDLPQPVLPSTATISPAATSNDSRSTASRSPRPKRHGHLEQILRHRAECVEDLEGEGRQGRQHHDEEDAKLDAMKPDDGDDHPGQRRDALQKHQHRRDIALDARRAADRQRHH